MIAELELPVHVPAANGEVTLRRATADDLGAIMRLLADDAVSAARGDRADPADEAAYAAALGRILDSAENELVIATDAAGTVVGTLQLTAIPGLARRGSLRLLVEAVRVSSALRSGGIGGAMMRWVMDVAAPAVGASIVQLTSDTARTDAHRFYTRLGFTASHVGFKYQV